MTWLLAPIVFLLGVICVLLVMIGLELTNIAYHAGRVARALERK